MRYILYARKSSESEDRQVQSIDDQLSVLKEHARKLGLQVVKVLTEAKSAKDPGKRQVFMEVLAKIEKGEADGILCWNINRLSRNPIDSGRIIWLLQLGVLKSVRTIDREYLPEDNVLLMSLESGMANQYILDLRKSVVRGMEAKASRGWLPVKPPQGYLVDSETKEIVVRQPQFDLLRRAWELLLSGSYTVPQIHSELSRWGYDSSRPREKERRLFSESNLYRIFDNPFYYGAFKFRSQTYIGKHKSMVSKEEFDLGQNLIHSEVHIQPKRNEFAFTGLIRCGNCGCMVSCDRKTKHYPGTSRTAVYEYYRCSRRRGGCREPSVTGAYVESEVCKKLREVEIPGEFASLVLKVVERDFFDSIGARGSFVLSREANVRAIEEKLERLLDLRLSRGITEEEYKCHRQKLQGELANVRARQDRSAVVRKAVNNAVRFGTSASRQFKQMNLKEKRHTARLLGSYVLTQGRLRITVHPLLVCLSRFEPPKNPLDMVQEGSSTSKIPVQWAWRERIRTLLTDKDIEHWCFEDDTLFDDSEIGADAGSAA